MKKILLTLLCTLLPLLGWAQENEPYAVLSDDNTVLTFYYDSQKAERNGMSVGPFDYPEYQSWYAEHKSIKTVVFDASFAGCTTLTSTAYWFYRCWNLAVISGIENLKTDNVTDMRSMFEGCSGLTDLDLSGFNTSNVMTMCSMFLGCGGLTTIYVGGGWSTNALDEYYSGGEYMFYDCSSLVGGKGTTYNGKYIDYTYAHIDYGERGPGYFTDKNADALAEAYTVLTDNNNNGMTLTFYYDSYKQQRGGMDIGPFNELSERGWNDNCGEITSVVFDWSFANDATLTSAAYWLSGFHGLREIIGIENLNTSNVVDMRGMFQYCIGLTSLDLSSFNTSNVTNMGGMFEGCIGLTSLDLSSLNTSNVTNMDYMFAGCIGLTSLDLSSLNTSNVTNMDYMFAGCSGLTSLDLSSLNMSNVTNMGGMFEGCSGLTSLDLSSLNTSNVTNMDYMFYGCSSLTTIYVGEGWNITAVTGGINGMFDGCSSLVGGRGTHYSKYDNNFRYARIDGGEYLPGYFTAKDIAAPTELYAVYDEGWCRLVFFYDNYKQLRNGMSAVSFKESLSRWDKENIYTVAFDVSCANDTTLTSMAEWLARLNIVEIRGIENLNTSNVTDMSGMFAGCIGLTSLDLSSLNTSNVTNMGGMFEGCSGLTSLDLSSLNTSNVTNMDYMFAGCSGLTSLDLSSLNTSNVTDMGGMFAGCSGLTSLDLSSLNTSDVTDMGGMFYGCRGLGSLDLSSFNTSNVTNMGGMFESCIGLTSLDLSSFNTANVTDMDYMFYGCSGLTSLDLGNFNTPNLMYMHNTFYACSSLTSLNLSNFDTSNFTDMSDMFRGCSALTSLDLSSFNTSNVTDMGCMFNGCSSLTSLNLSNFDTSNVTDMVEMFAGCSLLTSLDLSGFNTSNVTDMAGMFIECPSLVRLNLSSFNTLKVCDVEGMFWGCGNLKTVYVGEEWSMAAVTDYDCVDEMFQDCFNIVGGKGTKYDAAHIDYVYARIDQGPDSDAPGYFTRSGDAPWVKPAEPESTFDGRVLTVRGSGSIDQALAQVGGFELVDKTITAIVWEADAPYAGEAAFSNSNLLFYANDATKGQAISNLVYNGVAESITLTDEGEGNTDFYCPQSFTARSITYRRNFRQQTEIGVSRGWETIALPFTVQTIGRVRSDEGLDRITPFGSSEGERHFWLRRLTTNGLQSVQTIEANTPYIIAMPNSEEYAAEYNLAGDIVFTAENATVAVTEPVSDRSASYELTACFERMAAQDSIYVLNVGDARQGYPEGSIFEAGYRALQPFRAYTRHINDAQPAPRYFAIGSLGGDGTTGISMVGYDGDAPDAWYEMQGCKLQGKPTRKGVYIQNGRKVIVR